MRNALTALFLAVALAAPIAHAFNARTLALNTVALNSDANLTKRVKGALSASVGPSARGIEVIALDGAVSLQGRVPSLSVRDAAISAAERTPGVRSVANNLSVGVGG